MRGRTIAYVAFEGFPNRKGSGVRIRQMTRALAEAGAHVALLTLAGEGAPDLAEGVAHYPIRIAEQNYLCRALAFRRAVSKALYGLSPDAVHVRGPWEGGAAADWAARSDRPFIFEVNGLPSVELRYHYPAVARAVAFERKLREEEQRQIRQASLVFTQSKATARFVAMRAGLDELPVVIPNGADPELFAPPETERNDGTLRILYAGSFAPWQGLLDLFAAVRDRRHHFDIRLTVIGKGRRTWMKQLTRQARRTKVARIMEIVDGTDQRELAQAVRRADLCAAPLRRDVRNRVQGCSPIKLFEYMAAGRCVIASDLPCVREIVEPGVTGLLARPSNPHRLRDVIAMVAEDAPLRRTLGLRARRFITEQATWAHRRQALASLYAGLPPLSSA